MRRDRELMRRSALLRRLHGRSCRACCCGGCDCTRATRSLDASHSELRPSSAARHSPVSGRTSPKRLRLDSPTPRDSRLILSAPSNDLVVSVSSNRTHNLGVSSYTDTDMFIASSTSESDYRDATDMSTSTFQCSEGMSIRTSTPVVGAHNITCYNERDENSFPDSSDTCSLSMCTAKEANTRADQNITKRTPSRDSIGTGKGIRTISAEKDACNVMPYNRPLTVETPSYDILEIVVSETLNTMTNPVANVDISEKNRIVKSPQEKTKRIYDTRSTNIDDYVSNILVESLNSLTDQLESMNASIGVNGKLNIIEKEIKVKLQNTGVNTVVHLSPTSNNQIIFGHEELCCSDERRDSYIDFRNNSISPGIRDEFQSPGNNNNQTSADSLPPSVSPEHHKSESFSNVIQSENVNKAVLQQIQKLFRDDIQKMETDKPYLKDNIPSISHIEISDVDVYIDSKVGSFSTTENGAEKETLKGLDTSELISSVGTGNYYEKSIDNAIVPRFSAFPHTDSMEVNTSSSDDAEVIGSECTSLVDSLDDPNSPRSIMLRKSAKRNELVRSSIDILDLLPENVHRTECLSLKDKGESFFVRLKDDNCECDCEKKDIVVADHMPETIKQRLLRRHRKRELRMESARRSKVKELRRELQRQRQSELRKSKKEIEKECIAIINALIDEVITKITQDEYKCMRIKQKSIMMVSAKSEESLFRKNWKKDIELNNNNRISKNNTTRSCSEGMNNKYQKAEKYQIRGKLSLQTYSPLTSDDNNTKRIYQKSEIHDGKKCIEILEILEYVNGSGSSPETGNSDDNQNTKYKKSRIPVPVLEKVGSQNSIRSGTSRTQLFHNRNDKMSACSPSSSQITFSDQSLRAGSPAFNVSPTQTPCRASVSSCESRARSNSLRFKRVFDIIPEERSSFSVDSPNNEQTQSRRASVPSLGNRLSADSETGFKKSCVAAEIAEQKQYLKVNSSSDKNTKETRSAGTSPMPKSDAYHNVLTQTSGLAITSPLQRSAATSPIRNLSMSTQTPLPRRKSISNQHHQSQQHHQKNKTQQMGTPPREQPRPEPPPPRPAQPQHHQQPRLMRHRVAPEPAPRQRPVEGTAARICAFPLIAHRTASTIPVE